MSVTMNARLSEQDLA